MEILVVDNGTRHLRSLTHLLESHHVPVVHRDDLRPRQAQHVDLVILTGGSSNNRHNHKPPAPVVGNEQLYGPQIEVIQNSLTPLIAICLAHQLLVQSCGGTVELMQQRQSGLVDIQVTQDHPFFQGADRFQAFASHRWHAVDLPPQLKVLARSATSIQAVCHSHRPVLGLQFPPEVAIPGHDSRDMFLKYLSCIQ